MSEVFLKILNMSIAASWLLLAVMLVRFALKKAPRWSVVLLWGIAALRLAVPFSLESVLSLIPSAETFKAYNAQYEAPAISSGIPAVNNAINPILGKTFAPNPGESVNPLYAWTFAASLIWLAGIAAMLLYAAISYARVHRSVAERVPYAGNIFLCDHVKSPFILGLARPKIYLPSNMDAAAMKPVIAHEKAHLARHDHWWKPIGFLILAVHWFNPLCWIAYALLCRDIELACDEKVIRQMDMEGRKQYSAALLECSTWRRLVAVCPLAFGEVGVKERVKNVLNYKKPAFWIVTAALAACAIVAVCFLTNPPRSREIPDGKSESENNQMLSNKKSESENNQMLSNKKSESENNQMLSNKKSESEGAQMLSNKKSESESTQISLNGKSENESLQRLMEKYPEYFQLGTFKGLEVYVWQMAKDSYSFGLMQGTNREKTLEEKMALKGATAEEMALILSSFDIEEQNIFVIPWGNPISSYMVTEEMVKDPEYINNIRALLGLNGISAGSAGSPKGAGEWAVVEPDTAAAVFSEEQTAIRKAILGHNRSADTPTDILSCCSFVTLAAASGTPAPENNVCKATYYGWALYEEYKVTDQGLETIGGSHIPVALTFEYDEFGYSLLEYWEPRGGSYLEEDVRGKFPADAVEDGMDSQKFLLWQTQECYAQAAESAGLDTGKIIGTLIETICSSPAWSSNPADYTKEHFAEYRELTYYGRYTLEYCFAEFEKGGMTGLDGHIMRLACEEIAAGWGEALLYDYPVDTGQEWYNAFKSNALSLMGQYKETELAEHYPASYLLLHMLGEI